MTSRPFDLPRYGVGCAPLGNLYRRLSETEARETLEECTERGFRFYDTAPYYGMGLSERRLGDHLRQLNPDQYSLSTKVGRLLVPEISCSRRSLRYGFETSMPFDQRYDYSYSGVMRSYEASLQRLGLAKIDLLLVHDLGELTHGEENEHHMADLAEGGYRALEELRSNGDVAAIGIGANEWQVCIDAMEIGTWDVFLLAGRYTLLDQKALTEFFASCKQHGAKVIAAGVYNSGILATGATSGAPLHYDYTVAPPEIVARVKAIEEVCARFGVTLAAAALQFPGAHEAVRSTLVGVATASEVRQTALLRDETIPVEFWEQLKTLGYVDKHAPVPAMATRCEN